MPSGFPGSFTICIEAGCDKKAQDNGRCDTHRKQYRRVNELGFRARESANRNAWRKRNKDRANSTQRRSRPVWIAKLKDQCYSAYGGYVCKCCGITNPLFLTLDHVNDDGHKFRKHRPNIGGGKIYQWIVRNRFPEGMFQILCFNCNSGRARNGRVCPHKDEICQIMMPLQEEQSLTLFHPSAT